MIYKGSCHCGQIAFEAEGNLEQVMECNCSICSKRGALHWFIPRENFRLHIRRRYGHIHIQQTHHSASLLSQVWMCAV